MGSPSEKLAVELLRRGRNNEVEGLGWFLQRQESGPVKLWRSASTLGSFFFLFFFLLKHWGLFDHKKKVRFILGFETLELLNQCRRVLFNYLTLCYRPSSYVAGLDIQSMAQVILNHQPSWLMILGQ